MERQQEPRPAEPLSSTRNQKSDKNTENSAEDRYVLHEEPQEALKHRAKRLRGWPSPVGPVPISLPYIAGIAQRLTVVWIKSKFGKQAPRLDVVHLKLHAIGCASATEDAFSPITFQREVAGCGLIHLLQF